LKSWIHRRGYQSELYVKGTSINPFKILNKHLIDLKIKNQLESKLIIEVDVLFFLARYRKRNLNLTLIVNEICSHYEN
jgi:hypothetical protein